MPSLVRSEGFFTRKQPPPNVVAMQPEPAKKSGWFGNILGRSSTLSDDEAFLAILLGAARADGVVSPEESNELAALTSRTKSLSGLSGSRVSEIRLRLDEKFKNQGVQNVLGEACLAIIAGKHPPEEIRMRAEFVFAHALDLVFADREVNQKEQEYIEELATQLKIDDVRAKQIAAVIEIKNAF